MLRDDSRIISDVYSRHQGLETNIESKFEQWKNGQRTSSDILNQISHDQSDVQNMRQQLHDALDSFLKYLDQMQAIIGENQAMPNSNLKLDVLKQEWQGYVNSSIDAMPI